MEAKQLLIVGATLIPITANICYIREGFMTWLTS